MSGDPIHWTKLPSAGFCTKHSIDTLTAALMSFYEDLLTPVDEDGYDSAFRFNSGEGNLGYLIGLENPEPDCKYGTSKIMFLPLPESPCDTRTLELTRDSFQNYLEKKLVEQP